MFFRTSTPLVAARVSPVTFAAHSPHVAPPPLVCAQTHREHGTLPEGVPQKTRLDKAALRWVSTGRELSHDLAYQPQDHGVLRPFA